MSQNPWLKSVGWWLLGAAGLLAVYGPALHGGWVWDDDAHIANNALLRTGAGLGRIWAEPGATMQYYPLTFSVWWLEYQLWGLDPLGYHVVNVLLHAAAAVLLWQVLVRLRAPGAGLAAAIFALHPVMVMSVAWMTETKNTLSAGLALGAIWAYLRFAAVGVDAQRGDAAGASRPQGEAGGGAAGQERRGWFYALALGLFLLAMLAKTAVSFVPVTLLLILWWQKPQLRGADLWPLLPMLAMVGVMGRITVGVERLSGATGAGYDLGFPARALIAGRSFWFYLGKLVWPTHLTFIYPRWTVDAGVWWQWLFPLATGLLVAGLWLGRARLGKAPLAATLHFFLGTSALILGVTLYFTRFSFVADHWQYFGVPAICALAGAALARGLGCLSRTAARAITTGLLLGLAGATWAQSRVYANAETFYRAILADNPGSAMAHNNLAGILLDAAQAREAAGHIEEALRLEPNDAVAHNNLALAQSALGELESARAQDLEALRLKPDYAAARDNLAALLLRLHRPEEALTQANQAARLSPNDAEAHYLLGNLLLQLGRPAEALTPYEAALKLQPEHIAAQVNLGNALLLLGRGADARPHLETAVRLKPDNFDAHNSLGMALAATGKVPGAITQYEAALQLRPGAVATHCNVGYALLQAGRLPEAIGHFETALRLDPGHAGIQNAIDVARKAMTNGQ